MQDKLQRLYDAYRTRGAFLATCESLIMSMGNVARKREALVELRSKKNADQQLAFMQRLILA